jgi:hypothetical protein
MKKLPVFRIQPSEYVGFPYAGWWKREWERK